MNKIKLYETSKVYVLSPAYFKTGGTELLHQYVFVLKKNNINANIVYPNASDEKNINESFLVYTNNFLTLDDIVDDEKNVLIVPEIYTGYLKFFKKIKRIIWWESVDNYLQRVSFSFNIKKKLYKKSIGLLIRRLLNKNKNLKISELYKVDFHFVQSYYALDFLNRNGIKNSIFYVSDYINDIYLNSIFDIKNKENIVLYNPKKGYKFTSKIINKCKNNIKFIPLVNLTNSQVFDLLNRAKVYIDFGNHPGKDRFPREAAMCGCCILTNREGSAKFFEDVSIFDEYKFDSKNNNINLIISKINECLCDYEKKIVNFEEYRSKIIKEKSQFELDVVSCYDF